MKKNIQGQVLVIVVMVLMLLAIMILGIVAVVNRDVEQSLGSKEYELSYNKSEEQIFKVLNTFSDTKTSLSVLVSQGYPCSGGSVTGYNCNYLDGNLATRMKVIDTNIVEDFELGKDETFKVILSGYRQDITIQWTEQASISLTLEYKNGNEFFLKKDVYNKAGIYQSATTHELSMVAPSGTINTVVVDIGNSLNSGDVPLYLKIKPIMNEGIFTLLNVKGENNTFPNQVRRIEAVSFYDGQNVPSAAPVVMTQIPIAGQEPEILNYVIRTENEINKKKVSPY